MSGQAFFRWGGKRIAPADGPNFPLTMKNAGYETFHTEKPGNVATLIQASFEHINYIKENVERNSGEHGRKIVDNAVEFLDKRDPARPFFMYMGFEGPHDPRVAAPHYMELYQKDQIPLPKNFKPFHPFDNGDLVIRDEKLAPWPRTEDDTRKQLHDYYACISSIDTHLGRFLNKLNALNLYDNTYIIFTSDHGLAMGSHGLFGKQNIYEDGMRVPFIVVGPDVKKGQTSNAFCYLMDVFPTVCDLTGVNPPLKLDGISFAPVLRGLKDNARNKIFLSYLNVQKSCREGDYKLIRYPLINKTQLFNLAQDPHELNDISNHHLERCNHLLAALKEQQTLFGDTDPLEVTNPQPAEVNAEEINRRAKLGLENPLNMKKQ